MHILCYLNLLTIKQMIVSNLAQHDGPLKLINVFLLMMKKKNREKEKNFFSLIIIFQDDVTFFLSGEVNS